MYLEARYFESPCISILNFPSLSILNLLALVFWISSLSIFEICSLRLFISLFILNPLTFLFWIILSWCFEFSCLGILISDRLPTGLNFLKKLGGVLGKKSLLLNQSALALSYSTTWLIWFSITIWEFQI